jgi:hypothetical protein
MKLIITDARMPSEALQRLSTFGEVLAFASHNITYPSISGHPDIFIAQLENSCVVAPNTPKKIVKALDLKNIPYVFGKNIIGATYPYTAKYNALTDCKIILHNTQISDAVIIEKTKHLQRIHVNQGYCRCNCISLNGKAYICSDKGIERALKEAGMIAIYVKPNTIKLHGMKHGFFGGCVGVFDNNLVICGSLKNLQEEKSIEKLLLSIDFEVFELYDGPLIDVGGIIFI